MSKSMGLVGALGAFGALAYLLTPLPPESQPATTVVATADQTSPASPPAGQVAVRGSVAATMPAPRPAQDATVRLVQQIQTELLRLGCYSGAVDGRWSPETQQAMQALGERVRVLRPVETPDYIMLALARGQTSHLCAAPDRATASRQPARVMPMAASSETPVAPRVTNPSRRPSDRSQAASPSSRARAVTPSAPIESRPPTAESRATERERAVPDLEDDDVASSSQGRMGLGAAEVDPLRAGIDPRDPTAPAILRGPPLARAANDSGVVVIEPPPSPKETARAAIEPPSSSVPSRSVRSDWKRNFFARMRENGP